MPFRTAAGYSCSERQLRYHECGKGKLMRIAFEEIEAPPLCAGCSAPLAPDQLCELPGCGHSAVAVVMAGGHLSRGCRRHIAVVSARLLEHLSSLAA
jgi:hypothetical protein